MMNGMNMGKMMKQVKQMQKQMGAEQEQINSKEFTGKAPEDMVKVVFSGDRKMKDMQIKPEAIDPDDPDMMSDLVISAVNDALSQIDKETQDSLGKYTKGIPGM
ncbi:MULTISPECIES: YbaB/EbfC family nucleoid-associated protein [Apilactobacillus]|uniref:Nucleoid-associated protein DY114_06060 n=2 Tax=Apilactobacillus TaxID=2767877 RepID=A0A2S2JL43_9LACO|nr:MULTISPECIES: YbaB/EbfC family nucleoid-associated protein [Apilactobacillus]TPR12540.1 YbaB/EbfC family nucleoid-associated protein [Apilactobacillus timberlakei]TPR13371.1 YbaB/EbfC family nucleoid-associated protein [Apilactobacillus timberlakei]TPR15444.1 YbaB/EbfC family nucleoid-associated protein [Apilactobacillus timberlakei]TPR17703.1 YbaB/EbfC family nucleoid-associated protein [Apilactobacillus timberlakei]TPR17920.1 YbaB/EbfC family nucleoid-associated protein [Apilactobacillus 